MLLEQFDTVFNVVASIVCDSATYFKNDQLWRLDGNVNIETARRELILTNQLFYSQRRNEIYSDSFVHIEKTDRIIEGYGFVSNDRMTTYTLDSVSGIFPMEQRQQQRRDSVMAIDSLREDTVAVRRNHAAAANSDSNDGNQ